MPHSTMNKDSSVCGEPACDGMSVTIQGDILRATNVAFEGHGVTPVRSVLRADDLTNGLAN